MTILQARKVSKVFGGVKALDNCSITADSGLITALIGPNGAGKTTLFNAINGFLAVDSGQVMFDRSDVTDLPAWKRSRLGMSRTFQLSRHFKNLSLRDNLLLAARNDDDQFWRMLFRQNSDQEYLKIIEETLEFAGLKKDLETPAAALSYGEQKLFGLAGALVNPHRLLLLDEPVAGVNPVIRGKLIELLRRLKAKGETILLVEHDMDFVRNVGDHVIVLHQGAVLTEGDPRSVLTDRRVLEAYLGKLT